MGELMRLHPAPEMGGFSPAVSKKADGGLLGIGAEAELRLSEFLGMKAVVKDRVAKKYRNEILDWKIRSARTRQECAMLHRAKELGIRVPIIYKVDRKGARIFMEFCRGRRMKDVLSKRNIGLCRKVGKCIGKMHSAGIIHGDLTTSNILVHNGELCFIDFGLACHSGKVEDKAVDLLVFKKTYTATHFALPMGWELIVKGYLEEYPAGRAAVGRIKEVEGRVRYH